MIINKKLLALLFLLFVMPIISSWEFDNAKDFVKEPTDRYGTISISNAFGLGDTLIEYKLLDNSDYCLKNCYAEGIVALNTKAMLFENVEFKNMLNQKEISLSSFKIFYSNSTKLVEIEVNDYGIVCYNYTDTDGKNKTNCPTRKTGSHTEIVMEKIWEDARGVVLSEGIYSWRIEGTKKPEETIDWIGVTDNENIGDFKLTEWAVWTAGLNNQITSYWNMSCGVNNLTDSVAGKHNLSILGTPAVKTNGLIGCGYEVGTGHSLNTSSDGNSYNFGTRNYTINFWLNKTASGTADFVGTLDGGNNGYLIYSVNPTAELSIYGQNGDINLADSGGALPTGIWQMVTIMKNISGTYLYRNGTYLASTANQPNIAGVASLYIGRRYSGGVNYQGLVDEFGVWNRSLTYAEIQDLYNGGAGISYTDQFGGVPTVSLEYPPDNFLSNITTLNLNCSASDETEVKNISLIINGIVNYTLDGTGGATLNLSRTYTFADGTYTWTCRAVDNDNGLGTTSTYTFTADATPPTFTLISLSNISTTSMPVNATINVSISDSLSLCWYNTNENITNTTYTCNTARNISFNTGGIKNITLYANNTVGLLNTTTYQIYVWDFVVNQTGEALAGEGGSQTFTLLVNSTTFPIVNADANLYYDGVNKGATTKTLIGESYYFTTTFTIPQGTGNSTGKSISWYWNYNATNLPTRNTTTQTQKVYNVSISDCALASGRVILNLTLRDEELNTLVNVTSPNTALIELDLDITSRADSSIAWNFSKSWTNNQTVAVCVPMGLLNTTSYKIDFIAGYENTDHVREFYYLDNGTLNNSIYFNSHTDNTIELMDLLTADSTTFIFEYTDENNQEVDDIIVHTFRDYIGEGIFREVERSKQDDAGQTHVHLVEEDVIYYFMITQYGNVLFTSNTYNAKCLATPCEISLSASATETNWSIYTNQGGKYKVTVNKNTRMVRVTFALENVSFVNVSVYKLYNISSTPLLVNQSSTTASSGYIELYVPYIYGNSSFFVSIFRDGTFVKSEWVALTESARDYFGSFGVVLGGLVVLAIMLMAVSEGAGFIVFTVIAVAIVGIMQLVDISWASIILLAVAGAIIVYKLMGRRGTKQ